MALKRFGFILTLSMALNGMAMASKNCHGQLGGMALHEALPRSVEDTSSDRVVIFAADDMKFLVETFIPQYRPDFKVLVLRSEFNKKETIIALVPKRMGEAHQDEIIGQQVVQFQRVSAAPEDVVGFKEQNEDGALIALVNGKNFLGREKVQEVKTGIILAQPLRIEPMSFQDLKNYLVAHPRAVSYDQKSRFSKMAKLLFGKAWIKIFGPKGDFRALNASEKILQDTKLINEGKEKVLHVVGEIFHSELTINADSPYSGMLAPGKYFVIGRASSGMKNLDMKNEKGELEPNSIGISLLIFRTRDQAEVPGLLFFQDSLRPVANPGFTEYGFNNNPHFQFKPSNIREFFEQGLAVAGVAVAAAKNKRDSGRALQANYRTAFGAANNGVDLSSGDQVSAPRFISMRFTGQVDPHAQTHTQSAGSTTINQNATFELGASGDAHNWRPLGALTQIQWLGVDSHELTFPHGLSGTVDPQTLRVGTSNAGSQGILIPLKVNSTTP